MLQKDFDYFSVYPEDLFVLYKYLVTTLKSYGPNAIYQNIHRYIVQTIHQSYFPIKQFEHSILYYEGYIDYLTRNTNEFREYYMKRKERNFANPLLGESYYELGFVDLIATKEFQPDDFNPMIDSYIDQLESVYGDKNRLLLDFYALKGDHAYNCDDYQTAIDYYSRAVQMVKEIFGPTYETGRMVINYRYKLLLAEFEEMYRKILNHELVTGQEVLDLLERFRFSYKMVRNYHEDGLPQAETYTFDHEVKMDDLESLLNQVSLDDLYAVLEVHLSDELLVGKGGLLDVARLNYELTLEIFYEEVAKYHYKLDLNRMNLLVRKSMEGMDNDWETTFRYSRTTIETQRKLFATTDAGAETFVTQFILLLFNGVVKNAQIASVDMEEETFLNFLNSKLNFLENSQNFRKNITKEIIKVLKDVEHLR